MQQIPQYFNCGADGSDMFGYIICNSCKSKLGLFTEATIAKNITNYKESSKKLSYEDEIKRRLDFVEKDYIKKNLKLKYILEQVKKNKLMIILKNG